MNRDCMRGPRDGNHAFFVSSHPTKLVRPSAPITTKAPIHGVAMSSLALEIVGQAIAECFDEPAGIFKIKGRLLCKEQRTVGIGLR
jgi:hypothetical protein